MNEKIITIKHSEIENSMIDVVINLKRQNWNYTYESQKQWIDNNTDVDDIHVLLKIEEDYVAYLCICNIEVRIDGRQVAGKGLCNVCVGKDFQKSGYGRKIVEKANELIRDSDNVGVLLCHKHLVPFYEKCGWTELKNSDIEVCNKVFKHVAMLFNCNRDSISFIELNRNF